MPNYFNATVGNKVYSVSDSVRAFEVVGGKAVVVYTYWSTRPNGDAFGPQRGALHTASPKSAGGQIVAQAAEAFNVDTEAMLAELARRKAAAAPYTSVSVPLITKS